MSEPEATPDPNENEAGTDYFSAASSVLSGAAAGAAAAAEVAVAGASTAVAQLESESEYAALASTTIQSAAAGASDAVSSATAQASEAAAYAYDSAGLAAEMAKAEVIERFVIPMMESKLMEVRDGIKEGQTADPYMPKVVKSAISFAVDGVWEDLMDEATQGLRESLLAEAEDPNIAYPKPELCFLHPYWLRSFVLYHYFPYNKSIWEKLHDPVFLLLQLIVLVPIFGVRSMFFFVVLLFLTFPMPPDEFQLFQYIIAFKGNLFFTAGMISAVIGGFMYFGCTQNGTCYTDGPGAQESGWILVGDQLANMLLTYAAFWILPFSKKYGKKISYLECRAIKNKQLKEADDRKKAQAMGVAYKPPVEEEKPDPSDEFRSPCCFGSCGPLVDKRKAGNLRFLLYWDVFVALPLTVAWFCLSMAYTRGGLDDEVLHAANDDFNDEESYRRYRLRACLYWTRVVYAILSFPYVIFAAPLVSKIFSHTIPTGFDAWGRCVPLKIDYGNDSSKVASADSAV